MEENQEQNETRLVFCLFGPVLLLLLSFSSQLVPFGALVQLFAGTSLWYLVAVVTLPSLLTTHSMSQHRQIHLIHHTDEKLCVWNPSTYDIKLLRQRGFAITHVTGWRAYLGTTQHNYSHWTRALPEGRPDMAQLEGIPGVLPFEVYSQAPLRLISWCSFELPKTAKNYCAN